MNNPNNPNNVDLDYFIKTMKGGTPVTDIAQKTQQINKPIVQKHNIQHNAQHNKPNTQQKQKRNKHSSGIEHFTEDDTDNYISKINKSVDKINHSDTDTDIDIEKPKKKPRIPNIFKEPLLLLLIYIILSQNFIRTFFGKYITYINSDDDGNVSQLGIVIYGTIFVVFFLLSRLVFM